MKTGWNRLKRWCSDLWFDLTTDFTLPAGQTGIIDDLSDEVRDCHEHIATLDAYIGRLHGFNEGHWSARSRLAAEIEERDAEIARLRTAPVQAVVPFWLGLPNEILSLIVTTNMDGVQATLGGLGHDETSDDPRVNPTLAFALKPPDR